MKSMIGTKNGEYFKSSPFQGSSFNDIFYFASKDNVEIVSQLSISVYYCVSSISVHRTQRQRRRRRRRHARAESRVAAVRHSQPQAQEEYGRLCVVPQIRLVAAVVHVVLNVGRAGTCGQIWAINSHRTIANDTGRRLIHSHFTIFCVM
jgi:hypothetical protein